MSMREAMTPPEWASWEQSLTFLFAEIDDEKEITFDWLKFAHTQTNLEDRLHGAQPHHFGGSARLPSAENPIHHCTNVDSFTDAQSH